MPSSFAARTGAPLARTSSHHQLVSRRRLAVLCGVVGLALASGLIGSLMRPEPQPLPAHPTTGPFSYFPTE